MFFFPTLNRRRTSISFLHGNFTPASVPMAISLFISWWFTCAFLHHNHTINMYDVTMTVYKTCPCLCAARVSLIPMEHLVKRLSTFSRLCAPSKQKACVQRRPNVYDVSPTLYKCYTNVLCLPGCWEMSASGIILFFYLCKRGPDTPMDFRVNVSQRRFDLYQIYYDLVHISLSILSIFMLIYANWPVACKMIQNKHHWLENNEIDTEKQHCKWFGWATLRVNWFRNISHV